MLATLQVIDLISLKPFDMETISTSVMKTKRVIIVEECMKTGGIGASLSAQINESLFDFLDHQVMDHPNSQSLWLQIYTTSVVIKGWEKKVGAAKELHEKVGTLIFNLGRPACCR